VVFLLVDKKRFTLIVHWSNRTNDGLLLAVDLKARRGSKVLDSESRFCRRRLLLILDLAAF